MKNMSKIFFSLLLVLMPMQLMLASNKFQDETLKYVISYKWGLIHKDAGEATLSLRNKGNIYNIMLTAKTKPWADRIYQVRDTLKGSLRASDLKPLTYAKITHEKGKYNRDEILYSFDGASTIGTVKRYRTEKGKPVTKENTLTATGPVYDMLSVFYFLRKLDYSQLTQNKIYTATIFSGSQKENIKIRCLGKEKIKLKDKSEREAYHIKFNFTRNGGKKSSEDMDTWISTDERHLPLYLTGKLPIGEVRAYLIQQ